MKQTKDAFVQVKAILGKLDRSISEARSRRLGEAIEEIPDETQISRTPQEEPSEHSSPAPSTQPQPPAGYAKLRGQFGRAKALKPDTSFPSQ